MTARRVNQYASDLSLVFRNKIEGDTQDETYVERDGAKLLINDIIAASPVNHFNNSRKMVVNRSILPK